VSAVRLGHWVVLDELNLAPSDVLEALNRLLDDNRELFVPELQEVVRPHPHFMLFATQVSASVFSFWVALNCEAACEKIYSWNAIAARIDMPDVTAKLPSCLPVNMESQSDWPHVVVLPRTRPASTAVERSCPAPFGTASWSST
jgi:hypothetical protein